MSDQLRSWLRTTVPALWSAVITWLATLGAPQPLVDALGEAGTTLVVPLVLAAVYAGLRAAEPHLPAPLTRVLLGSNQPPSYTASVVRASTTERIDAPPATGQHRA